MYASGIYVTGLVPCLVNAVDFLLYKLKVKATHWHFPWTVMQISLTSMSCFTRSNIL